MPDPQEEIRDHKMTLDRLGDRMTDVEGKITGLSTGFLNMRDDFSGVKDAVNRLMEYSGTRHATKGMIPATYVTWGIGAALSGISVLLVVVTMAAGVVIFAMQSGDDKASLELEAVKGRMIEDDHREQQNRDRFEKLIVALGDFRAEQGEAHALLNSVSSQNKESVAEIRDWHSDFLPEYGKLEGKFDSLWAEFAELKREVANQ